MVETFPQGIINAIKQSLGGRVPGPPQVIGQLAQPADAAWQIEMVRNFCAKCRHVFFSKDAIIPKNQAFPDRLLKSCDEPFFIDDSAGV
jgi:hypothetical protein